jgi:hypothetical protein
MLSRASIDASSRPRGIPFFLRDAHAAVRETKTLSQQHRPHFNSLNYNLLNIPPLLGVLAVQQFAAQSGFEQKNDEFGFGSIGESC